jgi:hypothetical protein
MLSVPAAYREVMSTGDSFLPLRVVQYIECVGSGWFLIWIRDKRLRHTKRSRRVLLAVHRAQWKYMADTSERAAS